MADLAAIVVAAGSGRRFADAGPRKQYRELCGTPLLAWAIRPFLAHPEIGHTIVVVPPEDVENPPPWLRELPVERVAGGGERGDSVRNGLLHVPDAYGSVLIHDGARPLLGRDLLERLVDASRVGAAIPGLPLADTVKEVDDGGWIRRTVDRSRYWRVQTPQAFPLGVLRACHERAAAEGLSTTDDAALFERFGYPVRVIEGAEENIKVTTAIDLELAEVLARRLPRSEDTRPFE
ncbi:MAG TPA: 2-C-methyl-D-erythritol 4-phosphate cytidylyltransferase [Longimicrobiaceae bacterium]|nr:2-C-methyl-D-erythritol 4-phosphate cytidylyltransferase [Longimicrobiaceae bacterium]